MSDEKELRESNTELNVMVSRMQREIYEHVNHIRQLEQEITKLNAPLAMRIVCPACSTLHIDEGEFATKKHHTHACQKCGNVWRPAIWNTVGVRFLPGFKNEAPE